MVYTVGQKDGAGKAIFYMYIDGMAVTVEDDVDFDPQINTDVVDFINSEGSYVTNLGSKGRSLKFNLYGEVDDAPTFQQLHKTRKTVILTCESLLDYNGMYVIQSFQVKESVNNYFSASIELQEHTEVNVITQPSNSAIPSKTQAQQLSAQFKKCGTLTKKSTNKTCITQAQKLLQYVSFYLKYKNKKLKITGKYDKAMVYEVKRFQKKYKLKPITGNINTITKNKLLSVVAKKK